MVAPPELPSDEALALDESACAEAATAASAKPAKLLIVPATPVASATPDVASATLDFFAASAAVVAEPAAEPVTEPEPEIQARHVP